MQRLPAFVVCPRVASQGSAMKTMFSVVALGALSSIFSGLLVLPTARADCMLTADSCSSDSSGDGCCFAELGAVCDERSDGGSCCFPTKDDPDAFCTSNEDCCGELLCIADVCTDTIEFESENALFTIVETETEYGSGEYVVSSVTAQQEGSDAVIFELDEDEEVSFIFSGGEQLYPVPDETSSRRLQAVGEGAMTPVEWTERHAIEQRARNLSEIDLAVCEIAVRIICLIGASIACEILADLGGIGAEICATLVSEACDDVADDLTALCESIVDCEGDPHMRGLQGQKFDFSGQDGGWYAVLHDESFFVNMRVTAPIADLDEITYITGLGISTTDDSGDLHTVVLTVDNPLDMQPECPETGGPCLANGALTVELDGVKQTTPGEVSLGGGVFFSAANIPGECRPFGFEKYWQKKAAAHDTIVASGSRRLDLAPTSLWILSDDHKTNPVECREYVRTGMEEGTLFDYQSEHTSMQIRSDVLAIRVNHGKIHQVAMRDPTDQFDLPDHIAYQMNIDFERLNVGDYPQGVIGATAHMTKDQNGEDIMYGPDAIPGEEEDYRVSGPLGTELVASKP